MSEPMKLSIPTTVECWRLKDSILYHVDLLFHRNKGKEGIIIIFNLCLFKRFCTFIHELSKRFYISREQALQTYSRCA